MAARIKMSLGMEVGLGPGHIVLDGDPAPLFKKEAQLTQFSAHVCCGQTAGWMIKMLLGAMVGLGPGNIVLDADPAQPSRGTAPPKIWPMSLVAKQLDGSRCHLVRGRPRPRPHCVTFGPSSPSQKGHSPKFLAHVYYGQMVAHLSYC